MKFINWIRQWFKKEAFYGPLPGSVFNPIFRKVTDGAKITDTINIR
jgi:hypothetical protein